MSEFRNDLRQVLRIALGLALLFGGFALAVSNWAGFFGVLMAVLTMVIGFVMIEDNQ